MQRLSYLEELVNLGQIDPLLGIEFVNIAAVSIHKVQAKAHDLRHSSNVLEPSWLVVI